MELQQPQDDVPMGNGWDAWYEPDQGENEVQQEEDFQQQGSTSFDQSGSSAEYLRANGPDIVLNLDDVLNGRFQTTGSSSSSSANEASSIFLNTSEKGYLNDQFQAFDKLTKFSVPAMLQFPVTIDRFQLPDLRPNCVDDADIEDLSLAIVPYQVCMQ